MPKDIAEPLGLDEAITLSAKVAETLEGQAALAKTGMVVAKEIGHQPLEITLHALMVNAEASSKQMRNVKDQLAPATRRISLDRRLSLLREATSEVRALVEAVQLIDESTEQYPFALLEGLAYRRMETLLEAMAELADPAADKEQDPKALETVVDA